MRKKQEKLPKKSSSSSLLEPPWLHDNPDAMRIPYTEDELDQLVEGFIAGNGDSPAWQELVEEHGFYGAKEILRNSFIATDPNLDTEPIN